MSIERIKLIDSAENEFIFPRTFNLRAEPLSRRISISDIAGAHGGRDFSDGMFHPRRIEVGGKLWASSDEEFNAKWDELAKFLIKENLKLQFKGRQINILRAESTSIEYPSPVDFHLAEISIQFLAEDPFWYSIFPLTTIFNSGGTSPYVFSFTVGGNINDIFPIIKITNLANNPTFSLENVTDSNRRFIFADYNATANTVIEIDSEKGTVKLNETSKISSFNGRFLRLLGGRENQFQYNGANAKLEFFYREAWL